jgi:predicted aspartyl protease
MVPGTTCALAGLAALLISWLSPLSDQVAQEEVPFELYQRHLVVSKGAIGGLNGLNVLIDTGTIPSVVDARIARKLDLRLQPSLLVAFGVNVRVHSAVVDEFRLGSLRSGRIPVGVADLSYLQGVRVDAIAGLDVLARTNVGIDYQNRILQFHREPGAAPSVPLEIVWPFATVSVTVAGERVRLIVDTGSADFVLFKSRLPAALSDGPWKGDKTVQYASGVARLRRLDLRQLGLGASRWERLTGWALDRVPHGYPPDIDGVLGVRALGCRRVRLDFQRNEFGCSG